MGDRPILFSKPMVLALLAGRKTQTRRIAKFVEDLGDGIFHIRNSGGGIVNATEYDVRNDAADYAPISVGDRLWVRESLRATSNDQGTKWLSYAADGKDVWPLSEWRWKREALPSIHAPRWTSRITLDVTDVRVTRLQDISEDDARAEGISDGGCLNCGMPEPCGCEIPSPDARDAFAHLWMAINGDASWHANPFVVAYTFRVHLCNIYVMEA